MYPSLVRAAFKIVRNQTDARDIVQDAIVKFLNRKSKKTISVKLSTYLHRIVVNEALDHLKREKKKGTSLRDFAHQKSALESQTKTDYQRQLELRVKLALAELPEKCREVFIMAKIQEMKYREIAEELNISIKTVENQMGKAFKLLREKLKDTGKSLHVLLLLIP